MSVNEKMTAIADAIRSKTGGTEALTLDDMASGVNEVYEAGKQDERTTFWDAFQNKGGEKNYYYAFAHNRFTDANYNPQYPIVGTTDTTTGSQYIFYNADHITDTKVPIYANSRNITNTFYGCTGLVTIPLLVVHEELTYSGAFTGCGNLENITIGGTIVKAISFAPCTKLSHDSLMSIIGALKDYSGSGTTLTLTLGSENLAKLTDAEKQIATGKGWTLA